MAIENADYIPELVQSSPLGSAAVAEGDNEIRQIKKVLQQSWPDAPAGPIINAGENPSEPAEGLGAPTNVMLWSPLAIADFVKKYWSGWGLSPPSGQASMQVTRTVTQNVPNNTATKLVFGTTNWDTSSWWDGTSNRYIPQEAGIWRAHCSVWFDPDTATPSGRELILEIRVNGSVKHFFITLTEGNNLISAHVDGLVSLNGTTDYVEAWVTQKMGQTEQTGVSPKTWFECHRIGDA